MGLWSSSSFVKQPDWVRQTAQWREEYTKETERLRVEREKLDAERRAAAELKRQTIEQEKD